MAGLFSKPKMPTPIIPSVPTVPTPTEIDTAAKEAAAREAERIRKRKGAASTILTSPSGVTIAPTVLKEKLGE